MLFGLLREHPDQTAQIRGPLVETRSDKKSEVQSHLIVARTPRMQLLARSADDLGQTLFDVHVHIFEILPPDKGPVRDLAPDLLQARAQRRPKVKGMAFELWR